MTVQVPFISTYCTLGMRSLSPQTSSCTPSARQIRPDVNSTSLAYNGYQEEYDFTASVDRCAGSAEHNAGMYNSQAASESALSYSAFPGSAEISQYWGKLFIYPPEAPGDRGKNGINDMRSPKRRRMGIMSADSTSEPSSSSVSTS